MFPAREKGWSVSKQEMMELTRGISTIREDLEHFFDSDFLELRRMVGRHEA